MCFRKVVMCVGCFGLWLGQGVVYSEQLMSLEKALTQSFKGESVVDSHIWELSPEEIEHISSRAGVSFGTQHRPFVRIHRPQSSEDLGYAVEDMVNGKWGAIHFLVVMTPEGKVKNVMVLAYMEVRGKPIKKKRFLKQYFGKSKDDPLRLQQDIDGISGATISSQSLTDGIRKIVHMHKKGSKRYYQH